MNKLKNTYKSYKEIGKYTCLFAKTTIISVICLIIAFIYCENATHYELLLISDDLLALSKSLIGVGFLGIMIIGTIETNSKKE